MGSRVNKGRLGCGAAALALTIAAQPAHADPLDVTAATTTPVTTAQAANGSAGNVTVETAGTISVTTTGPALTVNSSNTVTNAGAISSSAASGATALLVDGTGGVTTTITNSGAINVTGTGGSGNYGLRIANGPVSGAISSATGSGITVQGDNSIGFSLESAFTGPISLNAVTTPGANSTAISLTAPLTGSLTLTGATVAAGSGDIAVLLGSPISGSVNNFGSLVSGAASTTTTASDGTTTTTGPAVGGPAVVDIRSSIAGGFVNDRTYTDSTGAVVSAAAATSSDTVTNGAITGYRGTTAILVQPGGASPGAIEIGAYGAAGSADAYGIINRGDIVTAGSTQGVSATAISITGAAADGTIYGATIDGGITNQKGASINATTTDADATGIRIGAGASVPTIVNAGGIAAQVTASAGGGNAYGISLGAESQVGTISNSGTIAATAGTGASAYGILDASGSLTRIDNSGSISAAGGTGGASRAIDLSAGTGSQTIVNSGAITGDIVFGSGATSYTSNSGAFTGTLAYGSGAGALNLAGTSVFANPVTVASGGTLAVNLADSSRLTFTGTSPTLTSLAASGTSALVIDVSAANAGLAVTGGASFTGSSTIQLALQKPVGDTSITILTAGGGISTDHASTLVGTASAPFLYSVTGYNVGANAISVTVHQKTGSEIGFVGGVAPLFDQSLLAVSAGGAEFAGLVALPDQASVLAAYRQIEPPSYGSADLRVAESLETAGFGAINARLDALAAEPTGHGQQGGRIGLWMQQGGDFLHNSDHQDDPGFEANTFVLAFGGDYALTNHIAAGLGMHFGFSNTGVDGASSSSGKPLSSSHVSGDAYLGWHGGPFYLQAIGSYGHDHYRFTRQIAFGGFSAVQGADWSGMQYGGSLTAGARFALGRFIVQPSDSFSYLHLQQDAYTETGGGAFDLAVGEQKQHLADNVARLAAGYDLPLAGGKLEIMGHGSYLSRLDRDPIALEASFLSGGSAFELTSETLPKSETEEGLSIGYRDNNLYLAVEGGRRQGSGARDTSAAIVLRGVF